MQYYTAEFIQDGQTYIWTTAAEGDPFQKRLLGREPAWRPTAAAVVPAPPALPKISIEGDTHVLTVELRNQRIDNGVPTADLVVKNNDHPIWYIVSLTPVGQPLNSASLPKRLVIPACTSEQIVRLTCEEQLLGPIPLVVPNSLGIVADGIGIDGQAQDQLQVIYGLEIFWRIVFGDPLPAHLAQAIGDAAFAMGDFTEEALATAPVVAVFWKIGGAAKAAAKGDVVGLVTAISGALNNSLIQEWLAARGYHVVGLPGLELAKRVTSLLELDISLLLEKWISSTDISGTIMISISSK